MGKGSQWREPDKARTERRPLAGAQAGGGGVAMRLDRWTTLQLIRPQGEEQKEV